MFSLIQKILNRAQSFNDLFDRIEKVESSLLRLEKIADENESLWQMLEEQREMEEVFVGNSDQFEEEFTDMMIRNMKPRGDA